MPLTISDEVLKDLKMDEREARIEIACRLYTADKLSKSACTRFTGLSRVEFQGELTRRGLPWIRVGVTQEDIQIELRSLEQWRREMVAEGKLTPHVAGH